MFEVQKRAPDKNNYHGNMYRKETRKPRCGAWKMIDVEKSGQG